MNILLKKNNNNCKLIVAEISENSFDLFEKIKPYLSAGEIKKYNTFTNEHRKKEWSGIRLLLKNLLGCYSEIKYNTNGNPYIEHHLNISITHSKNILGLILSNRKDIGMDVEIISPKILRTAHKFIADDELRLFKENEKIKKIYLNWCCKETLFKIKEHGGFNFKTDLKVFDSDVKPSGIKQTEIRFNRCIESYDLKYEFIKYKTTELLVVWH